jgi:hypothetical protein
MAVRIRQGANPPVVFIAQLGTGGDSWQPIVDRLDGIATFVYDRPGTGSAPPRPAPNPAIPYSVLADELVALLDEQGITDPAVIVGHSVDSLIGRAFADRHRHRVAGFVAVDGSIPQFKLYPKFEPVVDGDGEGATEIDFIAGQVEILAASALTVPAVVLTRSWNWWPAGREMEHPALGELWAVSQRQLALQWGAPLIVTDTGHQIPREAPDLVAYAVGAVVHAARSGSRVHLDDGRLAVLGGTREAQHMGEETKTVTVGHGTSGSPTGLPKGSIVATHDSALCRDEANKRFPWSETAGFALTDEVVQEMIADGHAVVLRVGFADAPPPRPDVEE